MEVLSMSEIYERSRNADLFEQTESTLECQTVPASEHSTQQESAGELRAAEPGSGSSSGSGANGEQKPAALKCCLHCDAALGASCLRRTIQNDLRAYLPPAELAALSAQFELAFCNLNCYNRFCAALVQQRPAAMVAFLHARLQGKPFSFEAPEQKVALPAATSFLPYASIVPTLSYKVNPACTRTGVLCYLLRLTLLLPSSSALKGSA